MEVFSVYIAVVAITGLLLGLILLYDRLHG
jgi:hypothetical protein